MSRASPQDTVDPITLSIRQVAYCLDVSANYARKLTRRATDPIPPTQALRKGVPAEFDGRDLIAWAVRQEVVRLEAAREAAAVGVGSDGEALDKMRESALLDRERRIKLELENEMTRGLLIPADTFRDCWANFASAIRNRLEALPVNLKAAQPSLDASAVGVVQREIAAALDDLARLRFDEATGVEASGVLGTLGADDTDAIDPEATLAEYAGAPVSPSAAPAP